MSTVPQAGLIDAVQRFVRWLDAYGETSYDHQSFFAGPIGRRAKALYYRNRWLGTAAVAPMIFCEAFVPRARCLFWRRQRFPIADAHYAMGFALLAQSPWIPDAYGRAVHFLGVLEQTRARAYRHYCWGYPFDWVTRTGVMKAGTPLITSVPYVYEAFAAVHALDGRPHWKTVMASTVEHALNDIKDRAIAADAASAGYNPLDAQAGVVNASAYRAFLLIDAGLRFDREDCVAAGRRNLNFVLRAQRDDGSWPYATDGVREFVDHFHTCFVLKALAKIEASTHDEACTAAIRAGVRYYLDHLFDDEGLPRPFARAPRLTVYRNELYDFAECINLGVLLAGRFRALDARVQATLRDLLARWQKRDGSFRSRRLLLGWDEVPMHRWAQSQIFRSLCLVLRAAVGDASRAPGANGSAVRRDAVTQS